MRKQDNQGFTLIELLIVVAIIGVIAAIAVPGLMQARMSGNEVSAFGSLKAINEAQVLYSSVCGSGFFSPSLENLGTAPTGTGHAFLGPDLGRAGTVQKSGYLVVMSGTPVSEAPSTCNGLPAGTALGSYKAGADPVTGQGTRYFATNTTGTVFQHTASLYGSMPEVGSPNAGRPVQ